MPLVTTLAKHKSRIGFGVAVLIIVVAISKLLVGQVHADVPSYNQDDHRVAIKGYDTVAYFLESRPVLGSEKFSYEWEDAYWHFASAENRELFQANPARYAPQFGGYCALGIAFDQYVNIDPEAWTIVDGKLYLNKSIEVRDTQWRKESGKYIPEAEHNWYKNRDNLRDQRFSS